MLTSLTGYIIVGVAAAIGGSILFWMGMKYEQDRQKDRDEY